MEINQNKKVQQPGWLDVVWKPYFTMEIDHIQNKCLRVFYKTVPLKS